MAKVVEFKVFSEKDFDDCPLNFQNTIFKLLEKLKKEKKKIKVNKDKSIGRTIKSDALTLLNLSIVPETEKSDFIIKIFDEGDSQTNEGLNIEIGKQNVKITKTKTQR